MKIYLKILTLFVFIASVSACGFHKSPAERAEWFFEKGENYISDSLDDHGANDQQLATVELTMKKHKPAVTANLEQALINQKSVFKGVMAGKTGSDLLELEKQFHNANQKALRSIGTMHQELENVVGKKIWAAAATERENKFSRHSK